jgi:hypothetical protein
VTTRLTFTTNLQGGPIITVSRRQRRPCRREEGKHLGGGLKAADKGFAPASTLFKPEVVYGGKERADGRVMMVVVVVVVVMMMMMMM